MEFLTHSELKERVKTLEDWQSKNGEQHFHYQVVEFEKKYYLEVMDEMEDSGAPAMEVDSLRQCYNQIKNGTL